MSTKQVIVMRKDLNMRKGKIAAQAAHASLGVFSQNMEFYNQKMNDNNCIIGHFYLDNNAYNWFNNSFTKICVGCDSEDELLGIYSGAQLLNLPCILITDNGATEFNGIPTNTCVAIGPAKSEDIDAITGHLKLL